MINIVTIPKKLAKKGELVLVPKKEYQEFFAWKKAVKIRGYERWFWTPEWQKKELEADKAIQSGKVSISFSDHKKLTTALKSKRK